MTQTAVSRSAEAFNFRGRRSVLLAWIIAMPLVVFALFPLVWMVMSSFKDPADLYRNPVTWIPDSFTVESYLHVLTRTPFLRFLMNSVIVGIVSTVLVVVLSAMAGYGLARGRFRFRGAIRQGVLAAYVFPTILFVIPLFATVSVLGLVGTLPGVIAVHIAFNFPFCTWLMLQYFGSLPVEIEEAARVDGLSAFGVFTRIALPLSGPGIATTAIFAFINSWNEFLLSFVILGGGDNRTLPVGVYNFVGSEVAEWGPLMAATTMTILPMLLTFFLAQRYIVGGLTSGAVKS